MYTVSTIFHAHLFVFENYLFVILYFSVMSIFDFVQTNKII